MESKAHNHRPAWVSCVHPMQLPFDIFMVVRMPCASMGTTQMQQMPNSATPPTPTTIKNHAILEGPTSLKCSN